MKFKLTENFKIVNGIKFFQIQALKSFERIISGELGGWIEKDSNLSQELNAWVYGDARVYGDAWVSGNAQVYGNAQVFHVEHINVVKCLQLSIHHITIDGEFLNIGCCSFKIEHWLKNYKVIGIKNNYSESQIEEYGNAIRFIKRTYFKKEKSK